MFFSVLLCVKVTVPAYVRVCVCVHVSVCALVSVRS